MTEMETKKEEVAFDGIYMPKMSAAGKKAWETRNKKKPIRRRSNQKIIMRLLKLHARMLKVIGELNE